MTDLNELQQDSVASVQGPGERLRKAREAKAMSLQDVAGSLRLGTDIIDALEKDDFQRLPEAIFVRGYLRNYAALLGLPGEELVEAFSRCSGQAEQPTQLTKSYKRKQARSDDRSVRYVTYLIVLVLGALVVVWWHNQGTFPWSKDSSSVTPESAPATETTSVPAQKPAAPPPTVTVPASEPPPPMGVKTEPAAGAATESVASGGNTAESQQHSAEPSREPLPKAEPAPVPTPAPVPSPTEKAASPGGQPAIAGTQGSDVLSLRFNQDSWVEVRDATNQRVMYRLGKAGETRTARGKAPFRVFLGNSPGVQIEYNGSNFDQSGFAHGNVARFSVGGP